MANEIAEKGYTFCCAACGKVSRDKYGYQAHSYGWDESCMLNSFLTDDPRLVAMLNTIESAMDNKPNQAKEDWLKKDAEGEKDDQPKSAG